MDHAPSARLISVNLAGPADVLHGAWTGRVGRTGIGKKPVDGPVATGHEQLSGDTICDVDHHGAADQAVYAYAAEDARWWSAELGRDVAPGAFGENFTTEGVDVTGAVIGQRWAIGTAQFEVSVPRIPCRTFAGFWDVPNLIKWFTQVGRPGAYLRIHQPGEVRPGDAIEIVHTPQHGVTIGETFRALTGDRRLAHRLLEAPELPAEAHANARKWLAQPVG
jgi:MOSC domain-containing protein YiiM